MNRITWFLFGIAVLGLAAVGLLVGQGFLPSMQAMKGKLGTLAPLYITWGMIWMTVLMAVGLAIFLFATGLKEPDRR